MRRLLSTALAALTLLAAIPAAARPDDDHRGRREDRKYWKERDKAERKYWKERDKEARKHQRHRYYEDDDQGSPHRHRDHGDRRPVAPPWMNGYWRPGETRRYVALVPGDPSRCYVFLDGRWVLRQIRDPRARLDLEGAYRLPVAPPPVAPPRIGLDLHVVLFN